MKILNLKAHLLTTEGIDPEEIEIRVHPTQVLAWGERNEASFPELRVYIMLTSNRETYALKMTAVEFEKLLVDAISDPNEPGGILNATRTFDFWKGFPTPSSDGMKEFESGIAMSLSRDGAKLIGTTIIPSSTPGKVVVTITLEIKQRNWATTFLALRNENWTQADDFRDAENKH